ncbi:MAG: DNA repair protein [Paracoccaceae bacterium]
MNSLSYLKIVNFGQLAAMAILGGAALIGAVASGLAFAEILPWPQLSITYAGEAVPWAGMALQLGVTALLIMVALFLPSTRRVMRLETSHRDFEVNMDDVTRAYRAAHMADRAETFEMRREFDAVRERYQYLKDQPGLAEMDAELLTMAAQMSAQSRELAEVYSDEKVARARDSLVQRHADASELEARIQQAFADTRELKRLMEDVDAEESSVASQLDRLRTEVADLGVFEPEFVPARRVPHLASVPAE